MTSSKSAVSPPRIRRTSSASSRGAPTSAGTLCAITSTSRPLDLSPQPEKSFRCGDTIRNSANSVWCPRISRISRSAATPGWPIRGGLELESIQGLLDFGWWLRVAAVATYAAAFVSYAARLAVQRLKLDRVATGLAALAVAAHTAYLVTRWIAAGRIEILARQATGDVLSSSDRFWFMISHPPYTNLFDALNFVAWAMMVCYLIIERKWGLRIVGEIGRAQV